MKRLAAAMLAAASAGCGAGMPSADPLTPGQSRVQVVEAAAEIVAVLRLPVLQGWFWREGCADGGGPPFRGHLRIAYPLAPSHQVSRSEIAGMRQRLTEAGWGPDPSFRTHSIVLAKHAVRAVLRAQHPGLVTRGIEVIGECRDLTTTAHSAGGVVPVDLR